MNFTHRMKQLLQVLLRENAAVSVQSLAEEIGVSKRTVQRELESISEDLKPYRLGFASKTGVGVWIEGAEEDKRELFSLLSREEGYDASNREERRKRLILEVLKDKGLKKLFYYSSQFEVSEATISADLENIALWLSQYGLFVQRKPGSGIFIEGGEQNYRRAIRAFIRENMDSQAVRDAYLEPERKRLSYRALKNSSVGSLLDDEIVRKVSDCLAQVNHPRLLTLTESSYLGLVIHVSIAIRRIQKDELLEEDSFRGERRERDEDYEIAGEIAERLEDAFDILIPERELEYICLHLKGSKHEKIQLPAGQEEGEDTREIQQLVNHMVNAFDEEKSYGLRQDDEFIQGLLAHLQPTIVRILHDMEIQNPMLSEIRRSYPDVYCRCKRVAAVLEEKLGKKVPEEEIGYLAVHFGAALVRYEERNARGRRTRIAVVCSSGIGISRLMSSKLERIFRDRVSITAYGKNDITPYISSKVDFFVSSVPLEEEKEVVYVNPLLSEEDLEEIHRVLTEYEKRPDPVQDSSIFTVQLEEINRLAAQIGKIIKHMDFFKVDNSIGFEELLLAVAERMSPYSDRQELIRESLRRRERISTQIFSEFDFALLHAETRGVVRPCFGVCMTKDLGAFSEDYMKGIHLVFIMLVPEDAESRIDRDIFGYVSSMLIEDLSFIEACYRGEKEEIRSLLSERLKIYFNRYLSSMTG